MLQSDFKKIYDIIRAQDRLLSSYRVGKYDVPEWVWKALENKENLMEKLFEEYNRK